MRALIDANIIVSAALAKRDERSSLTQWLVSVALVAQRRFQLVTSYPLIDEIHGVLLRRGFDETFCAEFIGALTEHAQFVRIYGLPMGCPDPGDDKVLETALNANADVIVSRDGDLFHPRSLWAIQKTGIGIRSRPIRVASVRQFVDELNGGARFSPLIVWPLAA